MSFSILKLFQSVLVAAIAILTLNQQAIITVNAKPFSSSVKFLDANTNDCPLVDFQEQKCPVVCAVSPEMCPRTYNYHCTNSDRECRCKVDPEWVTCLPGSRKNSGLGPGELPYITVSIKQVTRSNHYEYFLGNCSFFAGFNRSSKDVAFNLCDEKSCVAHLSSEPLWIIYAFSLVLIFFCCLLFSVRKAFLRKHYLTDTNSSSSSSVISSACDIRKREDNGVDISCLNFNSHNTVRSPCTDTNDVDNTEYNKNIDNNTNPEKVIITKGKSEYTITDNGNQIVIATNNVDEQDQQQHQKIRYYRSDFFGTVVFVLFVAELFFLQASLSFLVYDYYLDIDNNPTVFVQSAGYLSWSFIVAWHIMTVSYIIVKIVGLGQLRSYFMLPVSSPKRATHALVTESTDYQDYLNCRPSTSTTTTYSKDSYDDSRFSQGNLNPNGIKMSNKSRFSIYQKTICELSSFLSKMQAKAGSLIGAGHTRWLYRIKTSQKRREVHFFVHNAIRHILDASCDKFVAQCEPIEDTMSTVIELAQQTLAKGGISVDTAVLRCERHGPNIIDVPPPSLLMFICEEITGWFYLYQFVMIWVWFYFSYWKMSALFFVLISGSVLFKTRARFSGYSRIFQLAHATQRITVLRDYVWCETSSAELVAGDIVAVSPGPMPFDMLLVEGEVFMDECHLTGESNPVRKIAPTVDAELNMSVMCTQNSKHVCRAGTSVSFVASYGSFTPQEQSVNELSEMYYTYGIVLSTGAASSRGKMICNVLNPRPLRLVFDEQFQIVALILLIYGLLCSVWVIIVFCYGSVSGWFYTLTVIIQVISPLMPTVLVFAQSVTSKRLAKIHNVWCTDFSRFTTAAKASIFCFDKTGTLTTDSREVSAYYSSLDKFQKPHVTPSAFSGVEDAILLSVTHSLTMLEGDEKAIGHPVDLAMFEFSKATLGDKAGDIIQLRNYPLCAIRHKTFDFDNKTQTMTAVVEIVPKDLETGAPILFSLNRNTNKNREKTQNSIRDYNADENDNNVDNNDDYDSGQAREFYVCVKGSPEAVSELAFYPDTRQSFENASRILMARGEYVLGFALGKVRGTLNDIAAADIQSIYANAELQLKGLLALSNPLKEDTKETVQALHEGGIETCMITGDNMLTAMHVARASGFVSEVTQFISYECGRILRCADTGANLEFDQALKLLENNARITITGQAWEACSDTAKESLLPFVTIFARMLPSHKTDVVKRWANRKITAMVGDGGNDCGALRAAHVGIAMGSSEAAMVAPFAAHDNRMISCVDIVRYSRGTLASSLGVYRFLILFGLTMTTMLMVTYYFNVVLKQFVWILIDGCITVTSAFTLAMMLPEKKLTQERPTGQLLSIQTILSVLIVYFVNMSMLATALIIMFNIDKYRCNGFNSTGIDAAKWWLLVNNYESAVFSITFVPMFINNAAISNFGYKHRRSWYRNWQYVALWSIFMLVWTGMALTDSQFSHFFGINIEFTAFGNGSISDNKIDFKDRLKLWLTGIVGCMVSMSIEKFCMLGPIREKLSRWRKSKLQEKKKQDNTIATSLYNSLSS